MCTTRTSHTQTIARIARALFGLSQILDLCKIEYMQVYFILPCVLLERFSCVMAYSYVNLKHRTDFLWLRFLCARRAMYKYIWLLRDV